METDMPYWLLQFLMERTQEQAKELTDYLDTWVSEAVCADMSYVANGGMK